MSDHWQTLLFHEHWIHKTIKVVNILGHLLQLFAVVSYSSKAICVQPFGNMSAVATPKGGVVQVALISFFGSKTSITLDLLPLESRVVSHYHQLYNQLQPFSTIALKNIVITGCPVAAS